MTEAVEEPPKKTVSISVIVHDCLRKEAAAARGVASRLYLAEMSADWAAVAAVRKMLVETSLELEGLATQALERT